MKGILVFGAQEGYFHSNESNIQNMGDIIQQIAAKQFAKTGIYISGTLTKSRAIYHKDWGCPSGGEIVYIYEASFNPEFAELKEWMEGVLSLAREIKEEFRQSTMTVEFVETKLIYLK